MWERIMRERLTEPLHLNLLSVPVLLFGSLRQRIAWDLVVRQPYAFGALEAADIARRTGVSTVTLVEVGVASGAGLLNLASIAERVADATGVRCEVHGFDTGTGMPAPVDYRDHPDLYREADFAMDVGALEQLLPGHVRLHLGPLQETVPRFLAELPAGAPIGFLALDVDYWSSTRDALALLRGAPEQYLPRAVVYVDDIALDEHNSAAGARLAIREFNAATPLRPLESHPFLEDRRLFRRAAWIKQTLFLHVLDHPRRSRSAPASQMPRYIENPYLSGPQPRELFHPDRAAG